LPSRETSNRHELMIRILPDCFVEEGNLTYGHGLALARQQALHWVEAERTKFAQAL
jgi:hypothetical protein